MTRGHTRTRLPERKLLSVIVPTEIADHSVTMCEGASARKLPQNRVCETIRWTPSEDALDHLAKRSQVALGTVDVLLVVLLLRNTQNLLPKIDGLRVPRGLLLVNNREII